jgi:hypothetical protein
VFGLETLTILHIEPGKMVFNTPDQDIEGLKETSLTENSVVRPVHASFNSKYPTEGAVRGSVLSLYRHCAIA